MTRKIKLSKINVATALRLLFYYSGQSIVEMLSFSACVMQLTSGCTQIISEGQYFDNPISYKPNVPYELCEDLFIGLFNRSECPIERCNPNEKQWGFIVPPRKNNKRGGEHEAPYSVNYWNNPDSVSAKFACYEVAANDEEIIDILPKGTIIKFLCIYRQRAFSLWFGYGTRDIPIGVIENGKYRGMVVELLDVSRKSPIMRPRNKFIKKRNNK